MTGPELRALRQRAGLSQIQLARMLGLSDKSGASTLSRWENGHVIPNGPTIYAIRDVCTREIQRRADAAIAEL